MFIAAFVIGFIKAWKFTFILFSSVVAMVAVVSIGFTICIGYYTKALAANGAGGTVAEEVFSSIKNAVAFGTEEKLARNYRKHLDISEYWGRRTMISIGLIMAFTPQNKFSTLPKGQSEVEIVDCRAFRPFYGLAR